MAAMPPTSTKRVSVVARLSRAASWGAANLGSFLDSLPVQVRSRQSTDASAGAAAPPVTLHAVAASPRSERTTAWQPVVRQARALVGLALLTIVSAVGVLLAPVIVDDPVVSWPRAGEPPRTTVLPLVPYRPLSLDATVPCAALSTLGQRAGGGEALRTLPPSTITPDELDIPAALSKRAKKDPSDEISAGLVIAAHRGMVQITASGTTVLRETLVSGGCTYRIMADAGGGRGLRDGGQRAAAAVPVPEGGEVGPDPEGPPA